MSILLTILAFLVAISLLVAVHEYGHYVVARACGIKVLRFSIGFGRPLWTRRAGADQTEYCISALPLGGYVKMLDERESTVDPAERHRSFQAQPIWQRIAVLLAGPAFNFLFVIVAFWGLFLYGVPGQKAVVGTVAEDSYAARADLRPGDTVVAVDGEQVASWERAFLGILEDMVDDGRIRLDVVGEGSDKVRSLTIDVGGDATRLTEPGTLLDGLGFRPWQLPPVIGELSEGGAAEAAGFLPGDRIVAIDDEPVSAFADMVRSVSTLEKPQELRIDYLRDGTPRQAYVTPQLVEVDGRSQYLLGIRADVTPAEDMYTVVRLGPLEALPAAVTRMIDETGFTLRMLGRMLTGDISVKNLSGPVSIAQYAGIAAERGLGDFVRFLAVISISLGVLNLAPVPMLDGGQIVYQLAEGIRGRPLSERAQIIGQQFGVLILLGVMGFAFYNDIARLFAAS